VNAKDHQPGVLIADEIGIGKMALTMGAMAFIIDIFWCQEARRGNQMVVTLMW